jgi:hypothetical protein
MKKGIMLSLAAVMFALVLAAPTKAHAGVRIGIAVGPVYPAPVYASPAYGYVVVNPRPEPYYYSPYAYGYSPNYHYPSYRSYGRYPVRDWRREHREHEWREHHEYDRRGYRR